MIYSIQFNQDILQSEIYSTIMKSVKQIYKLIKITEYPYEQIRQFMLTHYFPQDPLIKFLSVNPLTCMKILQKKFQYSYFSGFSYVYECQTPQQEKGIKSKQIASIMLSLPNKEYSQQDKNAQALVIPELLPVKKILQDVQNNYIPKQRQKSLHLFIGCTTKSHRNQGLLTSLSSQIENKAIKAGYIQFSAHCTNPISAHLLGKLDFKRQHQIQYKSFQYHGKYPFKDIQVDKIAFMIKNINQKSDILK